MVADNSTAVNETPFSLGLILGLIWKDMSIPSRPSFLSDDNRRLYIDGFKMGLLMQGRSIEELISGG